MGSKSKNKDRDRERSPTSTHKKKHKRRGSRSPENGVEKHKKSKKSKHRHHDRESESPAGNGHREPGGAESPSVVIEDNLLAKSPDPHRPTARVGEEWGGGGGGANERYNDVGAGGGLDDRFRGDRHRGGDGYDDDHHRSRPRQTNLYERRSPRDFSPLGEADIINLEKSATPPPPPVPPPQRREAPDAAGGGGGDSASLSIEETNRIRAKLGLKPLEVTGTKKDDEPPSGGLQEDIHVPATNISKDKEKEKIKEKLELIKEKRKVNQKLSKVKGLADSDSDDEVLGWVAKSRKAEAEKRKAAERAKMLDEMDDEFGVGKIVEEETQRRGGQLLGSGHYTSAHLTGLKVVHDQAEFSEEKSTILTLKDADILNNDEGDVLMNVNIAEDERTKKNLENKKGGAGAYKAYDDGDVDEYGQFKVKQILDKYDEEVDGPKQESFQLGRGGRYDTSAEAKMAEIRKHMSAQKQSLDSSAPTLATEYLSKDEMTFKKKKRRVKKVRQRGSGLLTADDLLADGGGDGGNEDLGNRRDRGVKRKDKDKMNAEDGGGGGGGGGEDDMDLDPQEIDAGWSTIEGPEVDLSGPVVDFEDDHKSFQRAMSKARKLKSTASETATSPSTSMAPPPPPSEAKVAAKVRVLEKLREAAEKKKKAKSGGGEGGGGGEEADGEVVRQKGEVLFNATSEFFRVLGELPTYGQSGNRDSDEEDQMDFEKETEAEKKIEEGIATGVSTVYGGRGIGTWNEVDDDDDEGAGGTDEAPLADKEMAFMDEEPSADKGLAGALQLAMKKGYVVHEEGKKAALATARAKEDLTSQNYSIEDKNMRDMDDKYSNRREERYTGPTSKFSEKEGYKPNVKLEYVDDYGNPMSQKEAFRFLSHKFHGKGSGKMKTEKRNKKLLEVESIKKMASGDTPLGTMKKLKEKQKAVGSAYVTLSGGKSQAGDLKK